MPSLRDPQLGVLACLRHIWQVTAYFRRAEPYVTVRYDLQRNNTFRFGFNRILVMCNQKSICDVFEPGLVRGHRLIGPND